MTVIDLQNAFGHCCSKLSLCKVKSSYENYLDVVFYVKDQGNQLPVSVCKKDDSELEVLNGDNEPINLVKMDSCLIPDTTSKCDCLIFNSKKLFLVEMKACSMGQRSNARKDAALQLTSTLDLLLNKGVVISQPTIEAIICFKTAKSYPVKASTNSMRAAIYQKYRIWLNEGNQIQF